MTAAARCYELAIAASDKHWLSSAEGVEALVRWVSTQRDPPATTGAAGAPVRWLTLHLPSQQWLKGAAIDKMR